MSARTAPRPPDEGTYVSTGALPPSPAVQEAVSAAYERYRTNTDGRLSDVYPSLAAAGPDRFGICVADVGGHVYSAGDAEIEFAIMSVAKPFVFALVCEAAGPARARECVGVNATGLPFNSVAAIEGSPDGRTNPMVNAGAIATTSLVPGETADAKWQAIREGLSRFAGRELELDDEIYACAAATNDRNRAIARLLASCDRLYFDPVESTDLYTRQSSLKVTARDLAIMGATLADGGVNPLTRERVVDAAACRYVLSVMTTAGLYETSGDWLYDVGLPGKSGIGGGIVTVSPGKCGLGTFAPLLDAAGNSVKGCLTAALLSKRLGMDLFASEPWRSTAPDSVV
ncbi:MAG TPA: glutaminase A [Gammaproteobacteria bacterium]